MVWPLKLGGCVDSGLNPNKTDMVGSQVIAGFKIENGVIIKKIICSLIPTTKLN